ncbi:MAG: hypothetical protein HYX32_07115 [Actinobacteria bacterium]|nr:hypothetical protein [Actinomycetota bacterium]
MIDEYLAVRVMAGAWPTELPDDDVALTASRWWRLLQRIHDPGTGQLSRLLATLGPDDQLVLRHPHPEVLEVLDPRPLLDDAAAINARYRSAGLLVAESLCAGLVHGRQLWFGPHRNVGVRLAEIADDLDIAIRVLG